MERHISKKEKVDILLSELKSKITKNNVDIMLDLLEWTNLKTNLIIIAEQKKRMIKEAKKKKQYPPKPLQISRGEIWDAKLGMNIGSEQNGSERNMSRPVLIIQNEINNKKSPNTIVAPLSKIEHRLNKDSEISEDELKQIEENLRPTEVLLRKTYVNEGERHLANPSIVLCQNIREISKERLVHKVTHIDDNLWNKINNALKASLGIE